MRTRHKIMLVDDHAIVRKGLRFLLKNIGDVEVVAETGDGRDALEMVREIKPDIVFMDITMEGMNGFEATLRVKEEFPDVRVIIFSMHKDEEYIVKALRLGASGYVLKDSDPRDLAIAIKTAVRGGIYLSPQISEKVIIDYLQRVGDKYDPFERLSHRQREVLQLIAEGHAIKEIADRLNIDIRTVEAHRKEIMSRLKINDVAGLVRYAVRKGLVSSE